MRDTIVRIAIRMQEILGGESVGERATTVLDDAAIEEAGNVKISLFLQPAAQLFRMIQSIIGRSEIAKAFRREIKCVASGLQAGRERRCEK